MTAHTYSLPARPLPKPRQQTPLRRLLLFSTALPLALLLSGAVFWMVPGVSLAHSVGRSMEPGLKQGDLLLLHRTSVDSIQIGDVIAFKRGDRPILHRVVEMEQTASGETVLVTKGDNNAWADPPIGASAVQAKLVTRIPLLGSVARTLGLRGGFDVYRYSVLMLSFGWLAVWVVRLRHGRTQSEGGMAPSNLARPALGSADRT